MYESVIFREYDIRGVYNKQFDDYFAELLGKAIVVYFKEQKGISNPKIAIGHDARVSCPAIVKALTKGFTESGADVVHLGMITSPMCYFSTFEVPGIQGAVQVTGSHNPPEYNGFKISIGNSTIFGVEIQKLLKIIKKDHYLSGKGKETSLDILPAYCKRYKKAQTSGERDQSGHVPLQRGFRAL